MRIAMIGQKGLPAHYGGIEKHVEMLSTELVKNGHTVLAYARSWYSPNKADNYKGVKIIYKPTVNTKHLDAIIHTFFSTFHAIKQKVDVIHYHGVGPALLSFIPRILSPRTKVIATFHCIDRYHKKWNFMARWFLLMGEYAACLFPHATIVVSRVLYNYCLNEYDQITSLITNGVSAPETINTKYLDTLNLKPNKYLAFASRLVAHKGAHYLIRAWQEARAANPELFREFKLVIAGGTVFTDAYVQELKTMAADDNSIVLPGWLNGEMLESFFAHCALFIQPSENEGMSLSILKAMSYGRPVLVSDIPENKEVISDDRFWFINADIKSLKNKLVELLQNKNLLQEAGQKNARAAADEYGWEKIAQKTADLYKETLAQTNISPELLKNLP